MHALSLYVNKTNGRRKYVSLECGDISVKEPLKKGNSSSVVMRVTNFTETVVITKSISYTHLGKQRR